MNVVFVHYALVDHVHLDCSIDCAIVYVSTAQLVRHAAQKISSGSTFHKRVQSSVCSVKKLQMKIKKKLPRGSENPCARKSEPGIFLPQPYKETIT